MNIRPQSESAGLSGGRLLALSQQPDMTESVFNELSGRIFSLCGIVFPPNKRQLVEIRLRKRLRALQLDSFDAYLGYLNSPNGSCEHEKMVNVVTTNLTSFFREAHHFSDLAQVLTAGSGSPGSARRLRIWSAACSTGEEPYSIAITALDAGLSSAGTDLRILATDLDTDALQNARRGIYATQRLKSCPPDLCRRYFAPLENGQVKVIKPVRNLIEFNQLNLHESWPVKGPFDVIFCRNVLIYFSDEDKRSIVSRFATLLRPGGTLYLGHSESLLGTHPELVKLGGTIFRKHP